MIDIQAIHKQYGSKLLFSEASARLNPRSRVGLIGPNGAGKSTLIKLILGREEVEAGKIIKPLQLTIGHLAQEHVWSSENCVLQETLGDLELENLRKRVSKLEESFAQATPDAEELDRYGRLLHELQEWNEAAREAKAKSILHGMGFSENDYTRKISEFSGGWQMRVALAKILLSDPEILILDEPTNHLDLESQLWVEEFLLNFSGSMILISHDTAFLNRIVNQVWEIDQNQIFSYKGNLDAFILQKQERIELLKAQKLNQDAKIASLEAFITRFGAKATKAKQAQSRQKQLDKIERIELPDDKKTIQFRFPPVPHSGKDVVTLKELSLSYGEKKIFQNLSWTIPKKSRNAIVGVNGAGKSSLLKLIAGKIAPSSGEHKLGQGVSIGYYDQMQGQTLDPNKTVLAELHDLAPHLSLTQIRSLAGAFLFSGDSVNKYCKVLSGGEKARVAMAKLLLLPVNFLILDEPTNHLDIESRGVLLDALSDFSGTLCIVSHDRDFVSSLVDHVLEITPAPGGSKVEHVLGGYDDYLARKIQETKEQSRPIENKQTEREKKSGPSNNKINAWKRELRDLEEKIAILEKEQKEIHENLAKDQSYDDPELIGKLVKRQGEIETELALRFKRWEELENELAGLET